MGIYEIVNSLAYTLLHSDLLISLLHTDTTTDAEELGYESDLVTGLHLNAKLA